MLLILLGVVGFTPRTGPFLETLFGVTVPPVFYLRSLLYVGCDGGHDQPMGRGGDQGTGLV